MIQPSKTKELTYDQNSSFFCNEAFHFETWYQTKSFFILRGVSKYGLLYERGIYVIFRFFASLLLNF